MKHFLKQSTTFLLILSMSCVYNVNAQEPKNVIQSNVNRQEEINVEYLDGFKEKLNINQKQSIVLQISNFQSEITRSKLTIKHLEKIIEVESKTVVNNTIEFEYLPQEVGFYTLEALELSNDNNSVQYNLYEDGVQIGVTGKKVFEVEDKKDENEIDNEAPVIEGDIEISQSQQQNLFADFQQITLIQNGRTFQIAPNIVTNDENLKYSYQIYDLSKQKWENLKVLVEDTKCEWQPPNGGDYWVHVTLQMSNGQTVTRTMGVRVTGARITEFTVDKQSPQSVQTEITLAGTVDNPLQETLQYEYLIYDGTYWNSLSKGDTMDPVCWKPNTTGLYLLCFQVYNVNGEVVEQRFMGYSVEQSYINISGIQVNDLDGGGMVLTSQNSTNDANTAYRWQTYDIDKKEWSIIKDWSTDNRAVWKAPKVGSYLINVEGKTQEGTVSQMAIGWYISGVQIVDFNSAFKSPQVELSNIRLSARVKNPLGQNLTYRYLCYDGKNWNDLSSQKKLQLYDWKPTQGTYLLCFQVIDEQGKEYNRFMGYAISGLTVDIRGMNVYTPNYKDYFMQANINTNDSDLTYKYMCYDLQSQVWSTLSEGKQTNAYWRPLKSGSYWLHVEITSSNGRVYTYTMGKGIEGFKVNYFVTSANSPQKPNTPIVLNAYGSNVLGENLTYRYLLYNGSTWSELSKSTSEHSCVWTPTQEGAYWLCYQVINEYGIIEQKTIGYWVRNRIDFEDRMSTFSTYSTNNANGTYNMMKALGVFNEVVIYPGQMLSFNGTTGYCGKVAGYLPAGVVGGVDYGGGICQASTTLYGAAIRAGLTIVERRNHSVASTYVPVGLDAMVNYGSSDLVIRNDYDFPVKIITYVSGRNLYADIYGNQPNWYDGINAYSWTTGRRTASAIRVYYKNGIEVRRDDLPNSYYSAPIG